MFFALNTPFRAHELLGAGEHSARAANLEAQLQAKTESLEPSRGSRGAQLEQVNRLQEEQRQRIYELVAVKRMHQQENLAAPGVVRLECRCCEDEGFQSRKDQGR